MSEKKELRAIDADYREAMRSRIKLADIIDKLTNHALNPAAYPMTTSQVKVALALVGYVLPQLKAVEHTKTPEKPLTREQLIERLTQIHAGAVVEPQRRTVAGDDSANGAIEVRH
jgi:hypothetical protein